MAERVLAELPDLLLSQGTTSFTVERAAQLSGVPVERVYSGLKRLTERGLIFSPARGFYVPIPPEFRSWGSVPAAEFIDPMMRYLDRRYYVGLLSAAELHGVAHQRPQAFQVMVDRQLAARRVGRAALRFYSNSKFESAATIAKPTPSGTILVSTPETTILDLTSRPRAGGGLDNVATVALGLLEEQQLDVDKLAEVARLYPASAVRRVGWILSQFSNLNVGLDARSAAPTMLDPHGGRHGPIDPRWRVIVNAKVEPDS